MSIQLFVPKFNIDECLIEIKECLELGWTGMGFKTQSFEEKWREYTGHKNSYFINSATAGLYLSVEIFKEELFWEDNDEILTTGLTFVSTNHAILKSNLTPIFCDVDDTLTLDPVDCINKITKKTRAIIFVGLGGNPGNLSKIKKVCSDFNLILIIDAAHMAGSRSEGKDPTIGADAVVYSFQAVKNLPTADSGMLCFNSSKLDEIARKKGWLGINKDTFNRFNEGNYKWRYSVDYIGDKYHGNSIMAAIAIVQLKTLDKDNLRRNEIADIYKDCFSSNNNIQMVSIRNNDYSSRHLFQIIVNNRDELMEYLNKKQIYPGVHYINNMEYSPYLLFKKETPNTEYYSNKLLSLPLHLNMTNDDARFVAHHVNQFYGLLL